MFEPAGSENRSWPEPMPDMLLEIVRELALPKNAAILDVGGSDSQGLNVLVAAGFGHLTVLDIAQATLARCQTQLGAAAANISWLVADNLDDAPRQWHRTICGTTVQGCIS